MVGRDNNREGKELLTTQNIPLHLIAWASMATDGTGSLVFIRAATADRSSRMNFGVYLGLYVDHLLTFKQMLRNSLNATSNYR